MKKVLRWIAVPFAAIAASFLLHIIITLWSGLNNAGYMLYTGTEGTSITKILLSLTRDFFVGGAFVLAGAYTAPTHQRTTAIVLATIDCTICVISLVYTIIVWSSILQCISIILTMVGAITAAKVMIGNVQRNEN